jgi:hypothetical protein
MAKRTPIPLHAQIRVVGQKKLHLAGRCGEVVADLGRHTYRVLLAYRQRKVVKKVRGRFVATILEDEQEEIILTGTYLLTTH